LSGFRFGSSEASRAAGYAANVADYQNPAGRLHELLTRFGDQSSASIQVAWAAVLDVADEEVALYLGDVALLLRAVRDAAANGTMRILRQDAPAGKPRVLATVAA
jgi:hypothetical protein